MKVSQLINYPTQNELEKEVLEILINDAADYESFESYVSDLFKMGCASGMVSSLIYYKDTITFYNKHKFDIAILINSHIDMLGVNCMADLFNEKFDKEDLLCLEQNNQNLLAWYAYEETIREIAIAWDLDIQIAS